MLLGYDPIGEKPFYLVYEVRGTQPIVAPLREEVIADVRVAAPCDVLMSASTVRGVIVTLTDLLEKH